MVCCRSAELMALMRESALGVGVGAGDAVGEGVAVGEGDGVGELAGERGGVCAGSSANVPKKSAAKKSRQTGRNILACDLSSPRGKGNIAAVMRTLEFDSCRRFVGGVSSDSEGPSGLRHGDSWIGEEVGLRHVGLRGEYAAAPSHRFPCRP